MSRPYACIRVRILPKNGLVLPQWPELWIASRWHWLECWVNWQALQRPLSENPSLLKIAAAHHTLPPANGTPGYLALEEGGGVTCPKTSHRLFHLC
jgi:hypothetical protein